MGFKIKILLVIIVNFVISFTVLSIYNNSSSYQKSFDSTKNQEILLVKDNAKYINEYLESKKNIINALAKNIIKYNDIESKRGLLILSQNSGKFDSVYAGYKNGLMSRSSGRDSYPKDGYDPRKRPWYKQALIEKKAGVTKPYPDSNTKKLTITVFAPIKKDNKIVGVIGSDIFLDEIVKTVLDIQVPYNGQAYLIDKNGKILIHKNRNLEGKQDSIKKVDGKILEFFENQSHIIATSKIDITKWYLTIKIEKDLAFASSKEEFITNIILGLIFSLIAVSILYVFLKKMLEPIETLKSGLNEFFKYLRHEKEHIELIKIDTNDEFGIMAKQINKQIENINQNFELEKKFIIQTSKVAESISCGDLSQSITANVKNIELNELKNIINEMISALNYNMGRILKILQEYENDNLTARINSKGKTKGAIKEVFDGLDSLGSTLSNVTSKNLENGLLLELDSKKLAFGLEEVVDSSNNQTKLLQNVTDNLENLTTKINLNTQKALDMKELSKTVRTSIHQGHLLANDTMTAMNNIYESTTSINDAIEQIDQIAFQTNILSLNAAVEAATAGEAGKGFAVVAGEVRTLANRSAEVAKEIQELVGIAQNKANDGKSIATNMQNDYETLNTQVKDTIVLIDDVTSNSQEQLREIKNINDKIVELNSANSNNVDIIHKTEDIAHHTTSMADELVENSKNKQFENKANILKKYNI
jgi:methyl-accepting chemotaxis protein